MAEDASWFCGESGPSVLWRLGPTTRGGVSPPAYVGWTKPGLPIRRVGFLICALALIVSGCASDVSPKAIGPTDQATAPDPGGSIRDFDLTARPARITLRSGLTADAWTYNGAVPGPLLRVSVGDLVRVHFHNQLPQGTTIHWHGLAVPNGEDGVAGVTQDPVPPGRTVTYAFVARAAGTYWYHSHERAADQVDRGLYGALVVDPRNEATAAVDETLVYGELPWGIVKTSPPPPSGPASLMTFVTYSVNGKTGAAIAPIRFSTGRLVRLRLVNAGYLTHYLHVEGVPVTITALDGHAIEGGPATEDALPLGAGERLDIEFNAPDHGTWLQMLDGAPPAADASVPLLPFGTDAPRASTSHVRVPLLDLLSYPAQAVQRAWPAGATANRTFTLVITEGGAPMPGMPEMAMTFQINGKSFPQTDALVVRTGDLVQITFVNQTSMEHAMHLHGHVFQVRARNGVMQPGILDKDTVVVAARTSITIGFVADNPGWWMLHCHELYHAEGGLMTLLRYEDVLRPAQLGGPWNSYPD